jgi:1-acyl-sn-glycerol-3-phosphate acyltransferase
MIYQILRWISSVALYWFYRDIRVVGFQRIPLHGPLLIAVNHQNALVDSLIVGWLMPRRVTMTAKATLSDNPIVALMFRLLHVVPLRRRRDESVRTSEPDRARNDQAFEEIIMLLARNGAVLIFPEGKSHNEERLEPLKTGLARLALQARAESTISGLKILPVGLVFEDKGTPGSVVSVQIGEAIEMDRWSGDDCLALTEEVATRLRGVSEGVVSEHALVPRRSTSGGRRSGIIRESLISIAAWWGRTTHRLPIHIARNFAIRRSRDPDQPAMLTILFGISLVVLTYTIQVAVVGILLRSFFVALLYLGSLLCGAYWAAFRQYDRS